jgi:NAD(P)-dependent dehydrogenase (short-subunit alcohol dehydrogenase family)
VDNDESVRAGFAQLGPIDVLVNNAGLGTMGAVEDLTLSDFKQVMETNFFGVIRCIQAVLPGMRERRSGCIVNMSSVAGRISGGAQAAYSGSKWALEALSEALACEVRAYGIRVAIVEPGVIATPIFGKMGEQKASAYPHKRRIEALFRARLKDAGSPYEVAEIVRGIVDGDSWQLRYPAGADAEPIMQSRARVSDEEWTAAGAASDEEWKERMRRGFGLEIEL